MNIGNHIKEHAVLGAIHNQMQSHSDASETLVNANAIRWIDQSGQGHGPAVSRASYGTFTVNFTEAATLTNGSPVVTGITNTIRIRKGMTVTGTGIPASTTILTVDSATQVTLSNNATATGATTLTFTAQTSSDPLAIFGYNHRVGGVESTPREGYAVLQIEGHYHNDSNDQVLMEWFAAFGIDGAGGQARPIFCWYDKVAKKPLSVDLSPGRDQKLNLYFGNFSGDWTGPSFEFEEDVFRVFASPHKPATGTVSFVVNSHTSGVSSFIMTADGANALTAPTMKYTCYASGGTREDRTLEIAMRSLNQAKTGTFNIHAEDGATLNSVFLSVGAAGFFNSSLIYFSSENMPAGYPTLTLNPRASQTRGIIEVNGNNNGTGAVEAQKWQLYPKGYVAVRESGNVTTDRAPGVGAQAVTTPTYTNKPGTTTPTGNPTAWIPFLTTAGALVWAPAWAD